jgi:hypothetical protein
MLMLTGSLIASAVAVSERLLFDLAKLGIFVIDIPETSMGILNFRSRMLKQTESERR